MFNQYWRNYPWALQFLLFIILLSVVFFVISLSVVPLSIRLIGVPLQDILDLSEHSSQKTVWAAIIIQIVQALGIFLAPSLLFAYLTHPSPRKYLGLSSAGKPAQWVFVVLMMIGAMPVLMTIQSFVGLIELSESASKLQEARHKTIEVFLSVRTIPGFILTFFALAILPAISEELFFRGIMFRMAVKGTGKIAYSIILSALVFALFHFDFHGFLSIFLAGVLLAYVYATTGSLWLSMVAHLVHNGLQVIIIYFFKENAVIKEMMEKDALPWYLPAIGIVLFCISFYMLRKNSTPLPANWSDDFTDEERLAMQESTEEE